MIDLVNQKEKKKLIQKDQLFPRLKKMNSSYFQV